MFTQKVLKCFLIVMALGLLPGVTPASASEGRQQEGQGSVVQQAESILVPYVTLRNKTGNPDPEDYFGGTRSQLRTGTCKVAFSPIWGLEELAESAPFYIPDEKIKLTEIRETDPEQLFDDIDRFVEQDNRNIVVYLHGYNIGFEKSCRRSALFQRSLGLQDRLLLFSWPADGNVLKYAWDEADLVWSVPYMADFIKQVVKRAGRGKVDVVAHSLGARGMVQALVRMACLEPGEPLLNELVLIAPDIDTDIFRQELSLIRQSVNRITVYLSENDKALKLSHEVHGYPRLGEAGEYLTVIEGVDTIDISDISTWRISGHLYHLFNPEVIADLTRLLHTGEPAGQRPSLKKVSRNGLPYWQLLPAVK